MTFVADKKLYLDNFVILDKISQKANMRSFSVEGLAASYSLGFANMTYL